uniref:Trans-2,3-dihydro-3-hydroxyanthranilate isomerase n=1 Tax=Opuntia streptacantha TaxID=393608 RepID=A0A7C8YX53_OPUST
MGKTRKPVKYVVVDAFTDCEFKGNPAAVCLLEEEREDEWLQSIAAEFNISETGFLIRIAASDSPNTRFQLRWFTPVTEVELCGHATLAAAHFCFTSKLTNGNTIEFSTLSGILSAKKVIEPKAQDSLGYENSEIEKPFFVELDFPAISLTDCNPNDASLVSKTLGGVSVIEIKKTAGDDLLAVLPSAKAVTDLQPQIENIKNCPGRGLIITAVAPSGSGFDFFSRFFCPKFGINEDPVCGSAHCALAAYWSKRLDKCELLAYAASPRSGVVKMHLDEQNNRVKLQGKAVSVMEGFVIV